MTEVKTESIPREVVNTAMSYNEYRKMIDKLLAENKTTGENHSEAMLHYTKMNVHRMKRLDKQIDLIPELEMKIKEINAKRIWLVLTEAWCGDAAQIVPLFEKMASLNNRIELKFILRDEHLEIMDQFLTNGRSRSIPKLICLDAETLEVLGDWGPRPKDAQELFETVRNTPDIAYQEVTEQLHKWYSGNQTESVQKELLPLLSEWK